MKKIALATLLLSASLSLGAQNKLSSYSQYFVAKQQAATTPEEVVQIRTQFHLKEQASTSYVRAFITLAPDADLTTLEAMGVQVNANYGTIITAHIPTQQLEAVASLPTVSYVEVATPVEQRLDQARALSHVDEVQLGQDLGSPFLGEDVVVGVIDMGLQYTHTNFYASDGTTLRVKRVWDQNAFGETPPEGYDYGGEYTTQEAIEAEISDTDYETHGTHVAGIAAGSNTKQNLQGVAPKADLVLVSLYSYGGSGDNASLSDAIKYIYDYATEVGKPCVVNMSLGSHLGPHDGTSTFDRVCDLLQGEGRLLVGSQGNEGSVPLHINSTFTPEKNTHKVLLTFLRSAKIGFVDLWGDANTPYKVQAVILNKRTGEVAMETEVIDVTQEETTTLYLRDIGTGSLSLSSSKDVTNEKYNTYFNISINELDFGYSIGLIITATDGTVHGWCDGQYTEFATKPLNDTWGVGNTQSTMGEIGGTGKRIISVGAYTSRNSFTNLTGNSYMIKGNVGEIASFSSHGPTADNRVKPDITAPGNMLISSFNNTMYQSYALYTTHADTLNGVTNYYGVLAGTSMSSPFVAGVLATWLEANPRLTPEDVRNILSNSATTDSITEAAATEAGNNTFGRGKINAWAGLKQLFVVSGEKESLAMREQSLWIRENEGVLNLLFAESQPQATVTITALSGATLATTTFQHIASGDCKQVDVSSLASGIYLVSVTTPQGVITKKVVL